jgi:hypothetical protein
VKLTDCVHSVLFKILSFLLDYLRELGFQMVLQITEKSRQSAGVGEDWKFEHINGK